MTVLFGIVKMPRHAFSALEHPVKVRIVLVLVLEWWEDLGGIVGRAHERYPTEAACKKDEEA